MDYHLGHVLVVEVEAGDEVLQNHLRDHQSGQQTEFCLGLRLALCRGFHRRMSLQGLLPISLHVHLQYDQKPR